MQPESIVDDTLKDVQRFRILCMGRTGVGKSSLINRVFRLENSLDAVRVEHYKPGQADLNEGLTPPENNYVVLHDSKGLEAGATKTFNDLDRFIRQRCNSNLPLKDQLHAVWLCTETPRAGGRIFETGDEDLLRLVHDTGTPVIIVFTKYDRLVRTKRVELQEDDDSLSEDVLRERSKEEAQKVLDVCIQSLEHTLGGMQTSKSQTLKAHHVNVSDQPGYEATISSLAQVTCDLVSDKLKLMWAIAQRASCQVKINACVDIAMSYHKTPPDPRGSSVRSIPLRDCLERVHQDIITCWNFRGGERTLCSGDFKQLMLYLVQDVHGSQDRGVPHVTPPLAIHKISAFVSRITAQSPPTTPTMDVIGLTSPFADWLSSAVMDDGPAVQRLFMAYAADLITVLKSLFDVVKPSFSDGTMWSELNRVFQAYERLDPREQIHRHICANFEHDRQISDPGSFRRELRELLEREPPLSGSERNGTGGRSAQDTRGPPASSSRTREPPSPSGVTASSPSAPSRGGSVQSPLVSAPSLPSAKPAKPGKSAKPPKPPKPAKPAKPAKPPKPAKPAKSAKPAKPAKPAKSQLPGPSREISSRGTPSHGPQPPSREVPRPPGDRAPLPISSATSPVAGVSPPAATVLPPAATVPSPAATVPPPVATVPPSAAHVPSHRGAQLPRPGIIGLLCPCLISRR